MTDSNDNRWNEYYAAVSKREPHPLLFEALALFPPVEPVSRLAVDLGCGGGIETQVLLRKGWDVLAIDNQPAAFEWMRGQIPIDQQSRLTTHLADFEGLELPPADLVWANLSLPFCQPAHFAPFWERMIAAIRPNGRFAGNFFGPRHAWSANEAMTFHSEAEVRALFESYTIEVFREEEGERQTAFQGPQHWHGFVVIACNR